jgi:hypothetical protein
MFPKVILASLLLAAISPPSKILCGRFFYILNSIYKKANKKYLIISPDSDSHRQKLPRTQSCLTLTQPQRDRQRAPGLCS